MKLQLTPGVAFLLKNLPYILAPCCAIYIALHFVSTQAGTGLLILLSSVLGIISLPVILWLCTAFSSYRDERNAAKTGVKLPPIVNCGWGIWGELKIALSIQENFLKGYPSDFVNDWPEKYGNTMLVRPLFSTFVFTTDPQVIKSILATQFDEFEKGPLSADYLGAVLGTGVFNSDGDMWRFHRSLTRPLFTKDRISDFDAFDRHGERVIRHICSKAKRGETMEFQEIINRFTLDSAASFLFGIDLDTVSALDNPSAAMLFNGCDPIEFSTAFSKAQSGVANRSLLGPLWPLAEIWGNRVKPDMEIVDAFLKPIVDKALKLGSVKGGSSKLYPNPTEVAGTVDDGDSLLDHLVKHTTDPTVIKDEILNILVAGKDTIASTITFIVYMLAEYPNVLARLREEILETVGRDRRPSAEDIKDMKYLRAVINETLRLYPVVPFDSRAPIKDAVVKSSETPYFIPKGIDVSYCVFMMHRRKDLWGPDALEFDPDRFIDERLQKYLVKNPFIFLPFNAGPRICLGQQFAYNEISFFITRLLQNFAAITLGTPTVPPLVSRVTEGRQAKEKVKLSVHLTMYIEGGLWVNMKES